MRDTFFTADSHFDHKNIIEHCERPFDNVDEMNETMVCNWNNTVASSDTVYIIGDFAFRRHAQWIKRLHGKKTLIVGSHDKMSGDTYSLFTDVVGSHRRPGILETTIDKKFIVMSSLPDGDLGFVLLWELALARALSRVGSKYGKNGYGLTSAWILLALHPFRGLTIKEAMAIKEAAWKKYWGEKKREKEGEEK